MTARMLPPDALIGLRTLRWILLHVHVTEMARHSPEYAVARLPERC